MVWFGDSQAAPATKPELASALQQLGEYSLSHADYPAAIAKSSECAAAFHALKNDAGEVGCLTITGRAQASQGNYVKAAASYSQALDIAKRQNLQEARIALLNNAGNVAYFLGRYDEAFRNYTEAEALLPAYKAEPWFARRQSVTLANLATLYQRLGQYEKALGVYRQLRTAPGNLRGSEQGQLLENSGTLFRRLGDPYKAIETYRAAKPLFEAAHDSPGLISISKNTGIALAFGMNRFEQAAPLFEQALSLARQSSNGREIAQAGIYQAESLRRAGHPKPAKILFEQALAASRKIADAEDEWKALYGLGQLAEAATNKPAALAFYLQAIARIESIRAAAGPPALRIGFLADKRDVYDGAIRLFLQQQPVPVARVFRLLEQAKARSFQDSLPASLKRPDLIAIQAALPPGTMLLDYWLSGGQLALVWMSHSASGLFQSTVPNPAAFAELGRELSRPGSATWKGRAALLSTSILPPEHFNAKSLIVVPDGEMQAVPFDLFSAPSGRLLVEDYEISYLPAAVLALAPHRPGNRWVAPWQTVFTGFANPLPGSREPSSDLYRADRRDPLSFSSAEVASAARLLGGHARLHTGAENRKQTLFTPATLNTPALHLATHAVADADDPDRSRILFSPASTDGPAEYLFAREIYALDLRRVSLAVLSACDTERGVTLRGEGVQSFSRALLAAGAASSLTTLWRVGDVSGKAFSDRFYAHLASRETVAAALRASKLEFYRSSGPLAHPFYWSVYSLNGDPRIVLPRAVPWTALLAAGLLLVAIALIARQRMRRQSPQPGLR